MIIGGGSFGDVGSILSERDRQQQLLLAAQREAMARNDAQTAHTANVGEANFQYHQQQDAIQRHQAEQAAQDAQHAAAFARQDVWHGQDVAHQKQQFDQAAGFHGDLLEHQKKELAQAEQLRTDALNERKRWHDLEDKRMADAALEKEIAAVGAPFAKRGDFADRQGAPWEVVQSQEDKARAAGDAIRQKHDLNGPGTPDQNSAGLRGPAGMPGRGVPVAWTPEDAYNEDKMNQPTGRENNSATSELNWTPDITHAAPGAEPVDPFNAWTASEHKRKQDMQRERLDESEAGKRATAKHLDSLEQARKDAAEAKLVAAEEKKAPQKAFLTMIESKKKQYPPAEQDAFIQATLARLSGELPENWEQNPVLNREIQQYVKEEALKAKLATPLHPYQQLTGTERWGNKHKPENEAALTRNAQNHQALIDMVKQPAQQQQVQQDSEMRIGPKVQTGPKTPDEAANVAMNAAIKAGKTREEIIAARKAAKANFK